jgi:PAS domain S-box-containing protein
MTPKAWLQFRGIAFFLAMLAFGFYGGGVRADSAVDTWRSDVNRTRMLAENDIPAAYKRARHLQEILPAGATSTDRIRVLNLLARIEVYLGDTESAATHARQAFGLAEKHGDRAGQAEADLNVALNAVNQGHIDEMASAVTHAMTVLDGIDRPDLLGEAMLRTSMMYRRMELFDDSVTMAMQALEIAKRNKNPRALTYAYQGLAMAYDSGGRAVETREYYAKMLEQARAAGSGLLEADARMGMGGALNSLGDTASAEAMIREAMAQYRAIGGPLSVSRSQFALADVMRTRGKVAEAASLLGDAAKIYERHNVKIGLWWALHTRSADFRTLGNIARADADAERAYKLAHEIGFPLYLKESARRLAEIAAVRGDYRRAYQLSVEATELSDRLAREKASQRILDLAKRYETESKQRQIDELTRHNEMQRAELRQNVLRQRWLWTAIAGGGVVFATTVFFLLRLRRSREEIRVLNANLDHLVHERTAELRQQTRYLRTLIDMLPVMAWLKDTESRFLAVNRAVAEVAGQPAEAMVGKTDLDFFPRAMAEAYRADDVQVIASQQEKIVEEQIVGTRGTVWLETYKAPVLDEDGTVLGTVGVARDITESKALAEAREAALAEAQRLARMRSEFLAQMSHELRTPLNGILGYAQVLRRDNNLNEKQKAGLNVIQQSGEHLLTLINDILDSAKIEAGRLELNMVDIPLQRFLQAITEIIGVKVGVKHLELVSDFAPDLPDVIRADERRLRQVLLNLLANAVKFTDHGKICLRVTFLPPARLCFEVRDSGIGIAEKDLETIFQPFEQVGEVRRRLGGTGLGLTISRQFVRLMGSDIEVESKVGEGSVFRFVLDVQVVDAQAAMPSLRVIKGYAGERKKLLVVDDVAVNRAVLIAMLKRSGFEIAEAENGLEGIEKARIMQPDLILMDVFMPEMDGIEATKRLRKLPVLQNVPIIAVSAGASGSDRDMCLDAGMNAFLPKPVDMGKLLAHIAGLLKLEWVYEQTEAGAIQSREADMQWVVPPQEEMEVLHRMALQGNMRDIVEMANRLAALDERYQAFADQLVQLARGYQSRAILSFVERHLDTKPAP